MNGTQSLPPGEWGAPAPAISPWRQCEIVTMDDTTLQVLLTLVRQYVDHWERYPTVDELKAHAVPCGPN